MSFYRCDGNILCMLDHASFIEAFGLEGQMSVPLNIDELQDDNILPFAEAQRIQEVAEFWYEDFRVFGASCKASNFFICSQDVR